VKEGLIAMRTIVTLMLAAALLAVAAPRASAESCTRSREYILTDSTAELPRQPSAYQLLFRVCLNTLTMSNVRDAFILRDGGIAIVPTMDNVAATAGTLAQFCRRYPTAVARFITRGELPLIASMGRAVDISSRSATSCARVTGHASP
jgi:hypothetical protein